MSQVQVTLGVILTKATTLNNFNILQIPLLVQMFSPSDVIYFQIHKIIHLLYFEIIKLKIRINYR